AAELARVSVWIGEIQWMQRNGFGIARNPILRPLDTIECRDAVLNSDGTETDWPAADVIIGNPPFLGVKKMINVLGERYTRDLRQAYAGRLSEFSDLVCWWFEKARDQVVEGQAKRVGLVATNSIRGGRNRLVLEAITKTLKIVEAWSDQPWIVEGAAVRVSLVCFGKAFCHSPHAMLDGVVVDQINSDLTGMHDGRGLDLTQAIRLKENRAVAFMATIKAGLFDISGEVARTWLQLPLNPNGHPNADTRPYHRETEAGSCQKGAVPSALVAVCRTLRRHAKTD
ncbi:MAG: DNA methyltransferase, partial [Geminicoccaceae bacterium]